MIATTVNNRWTLLLPDHRAAREEWQTGWEVERLQSMSQNIAQGDVVYDVGAEEGDLSALYAMWADEGDGGGTGGLVLIEPNPYVWPNMRAIWEANGLSDPIYTFVGFACDEIDQHPPQVEPIITEPHRGAWPAAAYGPLISDHGFRNHFERAHDTPRTTLDMVFAKSGVMPDVITMDVEGAENVVLLGAEQILSVKRPLVYVSLHWGPAFPHAWSRDRVIDFMRSRGYRAHYLAEDHEEHWLFWHPEARWPVEYEKLRR